VQSEDLLPREKADGGLVQGFLWKYGTKYAGAIKKIPILNEFAERYYWKLSGDSPSPSAPAASHFPTHDAGSDILIANLNYIGFREQLRHEGLKGIIKRLIFQVIGFFAWWQGQINKALHDLLARQEAQLTRQSELLARQEARLTRQSELLAVQEAQMAKQEAVIADRDRIIEELENRFSVLNRVEDALYEELTEQRTEIARQRREITERIDRGHTQ
jgi:hypothetical protein